MRPIKFRGKSVKGGEWFYGSLAMFPDSGSCHIIPCGTCKGENVICEYVEVESYTVGQYSGLDDKNGKEIYEDDVVTLKDNSVAVVKYQPNLCGFYAYFHTLDQWDMEVIGNIHDNPRYNK